MLLSGGQDSTTCLAWALDRFDRVETVGFDYGQRHRVELQCRGRVRAGLSALNHEWAPKLAGDHPIALASPGEVSNTALTRDMAIQIDESGLPARRTLDLSALSAAQLRQFQDICRTVKAAHPSTSAQEDGPMIGHDAGERPDEDDEDDD